MEGYDTLLLGQFFSMPGECLIGRSLIDADYLLPFFGAAFTRVSSLKAASGAARAVELRETILSTAVWRIRA